MLLIVIVVTQRPLKGYFRKTKGPEFSIRQGFADLVTAMVGGARNMIGIGVATAAAGIVVGTVTLTGIGLVMTEFVEFISGGNLILILLFTAFISLLLGMGLPTTANYIVVSTLMAPVIVDLGAKAGLIVPLIAVAPVRFLLRHPGRRHPAGGAGGLCRRRDLRRRSHPHRHPGLRLRHPHRHLALHLHLQHRDADDRRRNLVPLSAGGRRGGGGHDGLRRGHPELLSDAQPTLGNRGPAAGDLYPAQARLLVGYGLPAAQGK